MQGKMDVKVFIGVAIIIAGVVLFMDNALGFNFRVNLFDFWPLILIAFGLNSLVQPKEVRQPVWGWILVGVGSLFMLDNLHIIYFDFSDLWPLLLILIGFSMLKKHTSQGVPKGDPEYINLSFILGGGDHVYTSQKLKGGNVSAILGGGKIDLRRAGCEGESITIDVFAFWGGIEIMVPYHWKVNIQGTPIMGAVENQTNSIDNINGIEVNLPPKTLIVRGSAIMGAVEVKN
jgi:predicted membrane protein